MATGRDQELDRIVAREKPGFERLAAGRTSRTRRPAASDGGTPDVPALRAKRDALGLAIPPSQGERLISSRSRPPTLAGATGRSAPRNAPGHHILRVRHEQHGEADPLPSRVVVVSRETGRVIGEQG